jgi:hypothetical protein
VPIDCVYCGFVVGKVVYLSDLMAEEKLRFYQSKPETQKESGRKLRYNVHVRQGEGQDIGRKKQGRQWSQRHTLE